MKASAGPTLADFTRLLGPAKMEDKYRTEPAFACPFCADRGVQAVGTLHVGTEKDAAICHRCGYGSRDLRKMWIHLTGERFRSSRKTVTRDGLETAVKNIFQPQELFREGKTYTWDGHLPKEYRPITFPPKGIGGVYAGYLLDNRRLMETAVTGAKIGYCATGQYRGRIILPIHRRDRLAYFTTRSVRDLEAKAVHCDWPLDGVLYNMDAARKAETVVVCEGPFDALSIPASSGVGVATLRNGVSGDQMRTLERFKANRFIFMFDTDSIPSSVWHAWRFSKRTDAEVAFVDHRCCGTCSSRHACAYARPASALSARDLEGRCARYTPDKRRKDANDLISLIAAIIGRAVPVTLDSVILRLKGTPYENKLTA